MPPGHKSEASLDLIKFVVEQIQAAQKPTLNELQGLRQDMGKVSGQLEGINKRLGDHSDFVDRARPHIEALERKHTDRRNRDDTPTSITDKRRKIHWAVMIIIGGALTWAGERGIQVLINSLADKPPVAHGP